MKNIRKVLARIRKADLTFNLINDGDRIAVGISGGKDSSVLLYGLIHYKLYAKVKFEIVPIFLDLGFNAFNPQPLIEYFNGYGTTINIVEARSIYQILKLNTQEGKHLPCSICSRMKKAAINKAAHEFGCNKVAFGHHYDDAIETLFLNQFHGGRMSTFSPKMLLERENIVFIRPLVLAREDEIIKANKEMQIPIIESGCPANKHTQRETIKQDLKTLFSHYNQSNKNIENILLNTTHEDLWFDRKQFRIDKTNYLEEVYNVEQSLLLSEKYLVETGKPLKYTENVGYFLIRNQKSIKGILVCKVDENQQLNIYHVTDSCAKILPKIIKALGEHLYFNT